MTEAELRGILELCQERWPDLRHTFGVVAYWSVQLSYDDHDARLRPVA